jgi:hypothetical protein
LRRASPTLHPRSWQQAATRRSRAVRPLAGIDQCPRVGARRPAHFRHAFMAAARHFLDASRAFSSWIRPVDLLAGTPVGAGLSPCRDQASDRRARSSRHTHSSTGVRLRSGQRGGSDLWAGRSYPTLIVATSGEDRPVVQLALGRARRQLSVVQRAHWSSDCAGQAEPEAPTVGRGPATKPIGRWGSTR